MEPVAAPNFRPVAIFGDEGLAVFRLAIEIAGAAKIFGDVDGDLQGIFRAGSDDKMFGAHTKQELLDRKSVV